MNKDTQQALKAGFPIFVGYFPAAVAFGILAKGCEITLVECILFSAVVFAGASQFIALNLVMAGMGFPGIILTTLLVNFRHFLMSAYLSTRVGKMAKRYRYLMAFGVTDEVFSVLSLKKGELTKTFVYILQLSAYTGWVSGTIAGYVLGGFLPEVLTKSMAVALYSLLLAILLPEMKKSSIAVILTVSSGLLNTLLLKMDFLPKGWSIIICILIIALVGSFFVKEGSKEEAYE
jgi:4-azaleucine resistance transporter AzlC